MQRPSRCCTSRPEPPEPPLASAVAMYRGDGGDDDDSPASQEPIPGDLRYCPHIVVPTTLELGENQEALALVAGYVVYKCHHICADLGRPNTSEAAFPPLAGRWLRAISRGRLYVPSDWWLDVVRQFNVKFCEQMGPTIDREPGMRDRVIANVLAVAPEDLDGRVVLQLADTRMHLRLRWLNYAMLDVQLAKRSRTGRLRGRKGK